ncbi:MAG: MarR family transcriptional regulator [Gemmatimonadaceae bacterium]|nr:MarR family transcriptional regulator [Gemmatimonadaceae bacterium]
MPFRTPRPEAPPLPPVLEFLRALWSLNHALEVTSSAMHRTSGVTAQQRMILRIVGHLGTVGAGTLSALLHVHPGTLSAALRRLEGRGLLSRQRSENDARQVLVALTTQGEQLLKTSEGSVERAAASVLDGSDAASVEHALQLLEQMTRTLEARLAERREGSMEGAREGAPTEQA